MIVIADLHGGDLDDEKAKEEFREIRDVVAQEASSHRQTGYLCSLSGQRLMTNSRTYKVMWRRYKQRVLIAMSSQAFAQLVCVHAICSAVSA